MRAFVRDCVPSLPSSVWIIQVGNVVNTFGFGLVLPFELIYLHDHRGFSLPVSGLVITVSRVSLNLGSGAGGIVAGAIVARRAPCARSSCSTC